MRQHVEWTEGWSTHRAVWRSENGAPAPATIVIGRDGMDTAAALALLQAGTAVLWRGDFHRGKLLLVALGKALRASIGPTPSTAGATYAAHRRVQSERARTLGLLLVPVDAEGRVPLRRAPDLRLACEEAWPDLLTGPPGPSLTSLRELLGVIGAHEWRKNGVFIPALGAAIHPHYGVFSPVRGEYVTLVANAPLPFGCTRAFDVGTGTGVLAAVLSRRGVQQVTATDSDRRAVVCAHENFAKLGLRGASVVQADLFPPGRADLVVCNPPWLPGDPTSGIEGGVYDPGSTMLKRFLGGLRDHLEVDGEGWLIMSNFSELLGLRGDRELGDLFESAGLRVVGKRETHPTHGKASDTADPLHAARAAEVTSLWRLKPKLAGAPSLPPSPW